MLQLFGRCIPYSVPLPVSRLCPPRSVSSFRHRRNSRRLLCPVLSFIMTHTTAKLVETRWSPCYIADLFKDRETNQTQAKLDEIEAIGFGFLKLVPKWNVKQGILLMLAKAYGTETSTLSVDHGIIRVGLELFQRVFRIPPDVDDFPPFDNVNAAHKLKHGDLENCQESELWLSVWTAKELSATTATVQPEDCSELGGNDGGVMEGAAREDTMGVGLEREDTDHTIRPEGCRKHIFKTPTPPPRPIHPLPRGRKLTERDEQKIRGWGVDTSLDSQQTVASYEGRLHLVLEREDLCTLRPRAWLNNNVCRALDVLRIQ
ncbi:hypothetical protein AHAS_Ahas19G0135400 [Arachis hypogaea]